MTLQKNRAEFWSLEGVESPESEKPQGFSVSRGKTKWSTIDANGNELASQAYNYTWDAANRLVGMTSLNPTPPTVPDTLTFTYDGYGRRVGIVEFHGSTVLTSKTFVWVGFNLCEERDSTGHTVNKRFYSRGEQINGTNYYYTYDFLGSVREMVDSSGTVQARFDYDPWGRPVQLSGSLKSDFGYTGMYVNQTTGLNLTMFRAYSLDQGRWLSRDPVGELYGLNMNLYEMVKNDPIKLYDYLGLDATPGDGGGHGPGGHSYDNNNPVLPVVPGQNPYYPGLPPPQYYAPPGQFTGHWQDDCIWVQSIGPGQPYLAWDFCHRDCKGYPKAQGMPVPGSSW
jgi:RHS repeat-associated protein